MSRAISLAAIACLALLSACKPATGSGGPQGQGGAGAAAVPTSSPAPVAGPERRILALGDSLFAGYGLRPEQAYPVRLEAALRARGINARITNAGVSGDTTEDGARRLAFTLNSMGRAPDLVLISLGGNDMLRGLPPEATRANLETIFDELDRRHVPVVLMGMLAAPNLGPDYAKAFNPIYPALARKHHARLVPFFLRAVIDRPDLRLSDHIHPTVAGVEALVSSTLPTVRAALPPPPPEA